MHRVTAAVVFTAALTVGVEAADLPTRMPAANAPVVAPAIPAWSGFYVGVNAGYHFGDKEVQTTATPAGGAVPGSFRRVGLDNEGIIGGGQIGYNWQFGSWVTGVEADIQAAGINDDSTVSVGAGPGLLRATFSQDVEWLGTVRVALALRLIERLFLPREVLPMAVWKTQLLSAILS